MLVIILFALALSLDSLAVGISYGLQKIKLSHWALVIICICSCFVLTLSMFIGTQLAKIVSPDFVQVLGAGLLIILGGYIFIKNGFRLFFKKENAIVKMSIPPLGIVIQILQEPQKADRDQSGVINSKEAILLGVALSMDAFGAGIGAAFMGFSIILSGMIVGLSSFVFLSVGMHVGSKVITACGYEKIQLIPGILLILIGVFRMVV